MDLKREKRRVYLRCFALLLALWLALLGAFSAYMLTNARRQERQRFKDNANALGEALRGSSDRGDWRRIVQTYEGTNEISAALFTSEGQLREHTDPAGQWSVSLSNSTFYWSEAAGTVDITQWFSAEDLQEITTAAQAQGMVSMSLVLEDATRTARGEVVPRSLALRTSGGDTVLTIVNDSYDQYRGTAYAFGYITLSGVQPAAALAAAVNSQVVRDLQAIAADPSVLRAPGADYPRYLGGKAIVDDTVVTERPWGLLDQVYIAQTTDPITPYCWLVITGMSDVWDAAGPYWLATALISLAGFLLAAWLLAHMTWKGQRAHLLYERRRRETAAAITHDLKTPLAVIRACAENLAEAAPRTGRGTTPRRSSVRPRGWTGPCWTFWSWTGWRGRHRPSSWRTYRWRRWSPDRWRPCSPCGRRSRSSSRCPARSGRTGRHCPGWWRTCCGTPWSTATGPSRSRGTRRF